MKRGIKELKNIHKGQDIWIIGSGASMDFVDPSFFEGKITMGVNAVYCKFKCDYLVRKENKGIKEAYESGSKLIVSQYNRGVEHRKQNEVDGEYWYFKHLSNKQTDIDFSIVGTDKIIVSWSTITSAIHIAAYMGAKNIILCGHDCGMVDGNSNFNGYYSNLSDQKNDWYSNWIREIEDQTIQVRDKMKEVYSCNIYSLNPFASLNLEGHKFEGKET